MWHNIARRPIETSLFLEFSIGSYSLKVVTNEKGGAVGDVLTIIC
jgi:hypothetical protein